MSTIFRLNPDNLEFPPVDAALRHPNGLLAFGGDLGPSRLLAAYRNCIFPWFEEPQPILWWSPDPRMVLFPERIHVSRSLRRTLRGAEFRVSADTQFDRVICECAAPRGQRMETWIGDKMRRAYMELHRLGHAHSIEVWRANELVGGLYGIAIGRIFFGESMFSVVPDASKVALVYLAGQLRQWAFEIIDCQQDTTHLRHMGGETVAREQFRAIVNRGLDLPGPPHPWQLSWDYNDATWATR